MFWAVVLLLAFAPVGVEGRGGGMGEWIAVCPGDAELLVVGSGLGKEWEAFSRSRLYRHVSAWSEGREMLGRFRTALRGLETVGLGPKELVQLFGGRAALALFNRDLSDPDHVVMFAAEDAPELFRDLFTAAGFFAAVHGEAGGRSAVRNGVQFLSLASDLHMGHDRRLFVAGRRLEAVEAVWKAGETRPLAGDGLFAAMLSNFRQVPEQFVFARSAGVLGGLLPSWSSSALVGFSFRPAFTARAVLEAGGSVDVRKAFLDAGLSLQVLAYMPRSALYGRGLVPRADGWPDGEWMGRILPFRDPNLQRNITVYSSWFRVPVMTNAVSAAVFCRVYGGAKPSTNHVFVFRVRGRLGAEDYAKALWPGRDLRRGWYERKPVLYYEERPGEDGFNYLCLEDDMLVVADAFRPLAAALQAKETGRNLASAEAVRRAGKGLFMVFRTSVWAGLMWEEDQPALAKEAAERSSYLLFSASALKTGRNGVIIDLVNIAGDGKDSGR